MDPSANFAYSTILGGTILGSAGSPVTIILQTGDGVAFPGGGGAPGGEYDATIWPPGVRSLLTNAEIVRVTRNGDTLSTTARGRGGTTPNASIVAGYQVMAGPTALNPKLGIERLGIAPYDFEPGPLIWDDVYLKKVSPKTLLFVQTYNVAAVGGSGPDSAYIEAEGFTGGKSAPYLVSFGDLIAAGFTLQVRLVARIGNFSGGGTTFVRAMYRPVNVGAALGAVVAIPASEVSESSTFPPGAVRDSGWVDSGASGADDMLRFGIQAYNSLGGANVWAVSDSMIWGRWVK